MIIKKLTFILENCEVIEIDGKHIGDIGIRKIKEMIQRIAENSVDAYKECSEFYVEIHKDANQPYDQFNIGQPILPFERLRDYDDICDIEIEYENEDGVVITDKYVAKWAVKYGNFNDLQDSLIGPNGNLYLKIGKKEIGKYFLPGAMYEKHWAWTVD